MGFMFMTSPLGSGLKTELSAYVDSYLWAEYTRWIFRQGETTTSLENEDGIRAG